MRVAVLGGGLQGCATALALAERGLSVTLFDRNAHLLSRAAVANEGKIHLGYMYAADPTLATAKRMMQGALAFAPFFRRHLGEAAFGALSDPAVYLVHRDSQRTPEEVEAYLGEVHALVEQAAQGRTDDYFGQELLRPPRRWDNAAREAEFSPAHALAAFDTPEVAINPVALAAAIREAIAAEPAIEVRLGRTVTAVEEDGERLMVVSDGAEGNEREAFGQAVNALWDGRIAIDSGFGLRPARPWLHRLKYGVSFRQPDRACRRSATIISGPFGEVVCYGDGLTYLTWYPSCLLEISEALTPPDWPNHPGEPLRSKVAAETFAALAEIVLPLARVDLAGVEDLHVKGGAIVAWGETDIYDPGSELHRRYEIGVHSVGRFHSIDPGKLTMAPYFADVCADRIAGRA